MCPIPWTRIKQTKPDPNFDEVKKLLRDVKQQPEKLGVLCFSGGEPTLNPQLSTFLHFAVATFPKTEISLLSNGRTFAYPRMVELVQKIHKRKARFKVAIPLHGHTADLHDSITRVPGSFLQTITGINALLTVGIPVELRIVINKLNYQHMQDIARYISYRFPQVLFVACIVMDTEGEALRNHRRVVVRYKEFVPHLEKAIRIFRHHTIPIRLYHFPLCTLKPGYWNLTWHTLPDNELIFTKRCPSCNFKKFCMGIMDSYAKARGIQEFQPIRFRLQIKKSSQLTRPVESIKTKYRHAAIQSFMPKEYGPFAASLSDIIAAQYEIKPLARLSCHTLDEFKRYEHIFKKRQLYAFASPYKILSGNKQQYSYNDPRNGLVDANSDQEGTIYIYLSKNKEVAMHFLKHDPEISLKVPTFQKVKNFGEALGYPACCIKTYLQLMKKKMIKRYTHVYQKSYLLNNLLHNVSNYYLSFHAPCSFNCLHSIAHNQRILTALRQEEPLFAKKLAAMLKRPIIGWFNARLDRYLLDNKILAIFDGTMRNQTICYKQIAIVRMENLRSPELNRIAHNILNLIEIMAYANKISLSKNKIEVYLNDRKIDVITHHDVLRNVVFNFQ